MFAEFFYFQISDYTPSLKLVFLILILVILVFLLANNYIYLKYLEYIIMCEFALLLSLSLFSTVLEEIWKKRNGTFFSQTTLFGQEYLLQNQRTSHILF